MVADTTIILPREQVERLQQQAKSMGVELPTYLLFLEQVRDGRIDRKAQDAARFMLAKHGESLRKLAQ